VFGELVHLIRSWTSDIKQWTCLTDYRAADSGIVVETTVKYKNLVNFEYSVLTLLNID